MPNQPMQALAAIAGALLLAVAHPALAQVHGDVRLVNGSSAFEGRVEVFVDTYGPEWGQVCDDNWDDADAAVVCGQLGLDGGTSFANAHFGSDPNLGILLDDVLCTGSEARLLDCPAHPLGSHNCIRTEAAGVSCEEPAAPRLLIYPSTIVGGRTTDVSVSVTGFSGTETVSFALDSACDGLLSGFADVVTTDGLAYPTVQVEAGDAGSNAICTVTATGATSNGAATDTLTVLDRRCSDGNEPCASLLPNEVAENTATSVTLHAKNFSPGVEDVALFVHGYPEVEAESACTKNIELRAEDCPNEPCGAVFEMADSAEQTLTLTAGDFDATTWCALDVRKARGGFYNTSVLVPFVVTVDGVITPEPPPGSGGGGGTGGGGTGGGGSGGGGTGVGGTGGGEPANRAPQAAETLGDRMVRIGAVLEIDLSGAFADPDDDALAYAAESSDVAVARVETDGVAALTVRGVARGAATIRVTASDPDGATASQSFAVTVTGPEAAWYLPLALDATLQGFVRVLNHSDAAGEATVTATDDAGKTYEPLRLALGPRQVAAFNSGDLEAGNPAKGLTGGTGPGTGGWRLAIESQTLDVEALAYMRTADGFVTEMNATAPTGASEALEIVTFNPASNIEQVSLLRLVNPGTEDAEATVTGVDDAGLSAGAPVRLTLAAGAACMVDAAQLESGAGLACGPPQEGLGDGSGKWRLSVRSEQPLVAMSLLSNPAGHLTNLSGTAMADSEGAWHVDLFPAASDPRGWQGFVRVVNRSALGGAVTILANDDTDTRYESLRLNIGAGEAVHFNSEDLELGNLAKGLPGGTGSGEGTWRLRLHGDTDIEAQAYVRTADGFLTAMQARAPESGSGRRVAFFNPGSNENQASVLRLVNRSALDVPVSVDGTDDLGLRPGTTVRVVVPATDALELTAAELESGEAGAIESGALGNGTGKWRLRVDGEVAVLSVLSSPTGHLTNLSRADGSRGLGSLPAALLPPPAEVTLVSLGERQLRGHWNAVEGARYDVELLRDGVPDENRSLTRAQSLSFRWSSLSAGTYRIRVRSVNADRVGGPWRQSNAVVID